MDPNCGLPGSVVTNCVEPPDLGSFLLLEIKEEEGSPIRPNDNDDVCTDDETSPDWKLLVPEIEISVAGDNQLVTPEIIDPSCSSGSRRSSRAKRKKKKKPKKVEEAIKLLPHVYPPVPKSNVYGVFTCQVCQKVLSSQHSLNQHSFIHKGIMPFKCGDCHKLFRRRSTWLSHWKLNHDATRSPFQCNQCNGVFYNGQSLTRHRQTQHLIGP